MTKIFKKMFVYFLLKKFFFTKIKNMFPTSYLKFIKDNSK